MREPRVRTVVDLGAGVTLVVASETGDDGLAPPPTGRGSGSTRSRDQADRGDARWITGPGVGAWRASV